MLDTVDAALSPFANDEPELIELGPDEASLSFLQRIYRSPKQPMSRRMRAAIEALPFESPKLSATAVFPAGEDFATRLERAIARSGGKPIEHRQADIAEG